MVLKQSSHECKNYWNQAGPNSAQSDHPNSVLNSINYISIQQSELAAVLQFFSYNQFNSVQYSRTQLSPVTTF